MASVLGALVFAACTDGPPEISSTRPAPVVTAAADGRSTLDCNEVTIPRGIELDTNLDRNNGLLTVAFSDPDTGTNETVTVRYREPGCSYSENRSIGRVIEHALVTARPGRARETYVIAGCFKPVMRPKFMVYACADYGLRGNHIQWSTWTKWHASGRGNFVMKDFTKPDYGLGRRQGRIVLDGRRYCIRHERYTFWSGRIILDEPAEGRRRIAIHPTCGIT